MTNVTKTLRTVHAHRLACAAALSLLAACGAEVAGGAAAVGSLQATQAKEAKAQQQRIFNDLTKAQEAGMARAASAAE